MKKMGIPIREIGIDKNGKVIMKKIVRNLKIIHNKNA